MRKVYVKLNFQINLLCNSPFVYKNKQRDIKRSLAKSIDKK